MAAHTNKGSNEIRQTFELFFSKWKFILFCLISAICLGHLFFRYASNEYSASATIKIQDDKDSNKLTSIEDISSGGLFSDGNNKIKDEIAIIKSKSLLKNVVKGLRLNVRCYVEGKVKELETYKNSPIVVNFLVSDTVIDNLSTNIYIKVKSPFEFLWFEDEGKGLIERDEKTGTLYKFGDRIKTTFGDIIITPNADGNKPINNTNYKITLTAINNLVDDYQKMIVLNAEKGSSIINMVLKDSNPLRAVEFLNRLIAEYNNDVLNDKEEVVKVTSEFINKRLKEVESELGIVETNAEKIQQRTNSADLGSQTNLNLQAKKQLNQQITTTATNIQMIAYLEDEISDNNKISDMLPANIDIGGGNTNQIIKSHNDLVAQRDRLLKNSSEKNPTVIQLNNQINMLKQNLQGSLTSMKKTSELSLRNLNSESNRISGQLYVAPSKAKQLRGIQRQQDIKETLFLYLLEKREESAIRFGMYTPTAKIIDAASSSYRPISPNRTLIYLASILFGLALPIGLIYLIDLLDSKIHDKGDLAQLLDIPYIGDIPKTSKKEKLIKKTDYSPKAEAFRIIRSNVDFNLSQVSNRSKKLFITSTKTQEGKSHTSTNLASSISFSEKSVLLIEMDIRVPKILDYLGIKIKPKKGLTDFLADSSIKPQDIVLKKTDNKYLDIIPSGTIPPNPSELLMSDRVDLLFKFFEKKYDYIIADTSAVGLVSDTMLIAKYADLFIYVVSAEGVDKRQLVHIAKPLYDEQRLPNMKLLLNGTSTGKKGYGYGYGYGYGENPNKKKKWYQFT